MHVAYIKPPLMKASALFFHSDLLNRSQKQIYRTIRFPMFYFLETLAAVQNKLSVSLLCRYNLGNSFSEFFFFILNLTNTQKFSGNLMSIISSYDKQTHNSMFFLQRSTCCKVQNTKPLTFCSLVNEAVSKLKSYSIFHFCLIFLLLIISSSVRFLLSPYL